jgi:EAL domain-containing protein (putative c-di-GMP-specific phosphodiesterase class I)
VAEGVENLAQFELLKKFGCQYFQGYFFSKPLSAAGFEQLINRVQA